MREDFTSSLARALFDSLACAHRRDVSHFHHSVVRLQSDVRDHDGRKLLQTSKRGAAMAGREAEGRAFLTYGTRDGCQA